MGDPRRFPLNGVRLDGRPAYYRPEDAEAQGWLSPPAVPRTSRFRAPAYGVRVEDLASAGWGVIWAPGAERRIKPLLDDLLELRKQQAGGLIKMNQGKNEGGLYQSITLYPHEKCDLFLSRFGAHTGQPRPEQLPYYLLLVGSPEEISFQFQGELDQAYAVGRLHFDRDEQYRSYAESVIEAETRSSSRPRNRVALFGAANGDSATQRTTDRLIVPLAGRLRDAFEDRSGWDLETVTKADATRDRLADLLTEKPPDLLFTASHGMVIDEDPERQRLHQGALLCSEWQDGSKVSREMFLAAEDLRIDQRPLLGSMAFLLACHSGGTPLVDSFHPPGTTAPRLAPRPFVAALPQRLMGDGGALAVIAHADRAWTTSFDWDPLADDPNPAVFFDTLLPLIDGHRVGFATEALGALYGHLTRQSHGRGLQLSPRSLDHGHSVRLWRAANDIRGFVLYGDPAARLGNVAGEGATADRAMTGSKKKIRWR